MKIVDGNKIADSILQECKTRLVKSDIKPKLAIIMVGNNSASLTYIEKKRQAGEKVGVNVIIHKFEKATQQELLDLIEELNTNINVHGIIIQLPLPEGLNSYELCSAINPNKDVDGLNPINFGDLWLSPTPHLVPATVKSIEYILQYIASEEGQDYGSYISGKNILIINRSVIIGKPLAGALLNKDATITIVNVKTKNLDGIIANSDIIISGTGKESFISKQNFRQGTVLIDVGFNKTDKRIFGDVDKRMDTGMVSWLTPVPGGVGPVGVACLIENVVNQAFLLS